MGEDYNWFIKAAAYAVFSSLGGILGHLMRSVDSKQKITFGRTAMEGLAAGFVGLLVLLLCQAMGLSEQWTGVVVGVSGWLGASVTIRMLEVAVRKRLSLTKEEPDA